MIFFNVWIFHCCSNSYVCQKVPSIFLGKEGGKISFLVDTRAVPLKDLTADNLGMFFAAVLLFIPLLSFFTFIYLFTYFYTFIYMFTNSLTHIYFLIYFYTLIYHSSFIYFISTYLPNCGFSPSGSLGFSVTMLVRCSRLPSTIIPSPYVLHHLSASLRAVSSRTLATFSRILERSFSFLQIPVGDTLHLPVITI